MNQTHDQPKSNDATDPGCHERCVPDTVCYYNDKKYSAGAFITDADGRTLTCTAGSWELVPRESRPKATK